MVISITDTAGQELAARAHAHGQTVGRYLRSQLAVLGILRQTAGQGPRHELEGKPYIQFSLSVEEYQHILTLVQAPRDVAPSLVRWALDGLYVDADNASEIEI